MRGRQCVKAFPGFAGELSMTLENNVMINRFLEAIGATRYKTYRIYRKQLPC